MSYQIETYANSSAVLDEPSFSHAQPSLPPREVEPTRVHEPLRVREAAPLPGGLAHDEEVNSTSFFLKRKPLILRPPV